MTLDKPAVTKVLTNIEEETKNPLAVLDEFLPCLRRGKIPYFVTQTSKAKVFDIKSNTL